MEPGPTPPASPLLLRRLGALVYDILLNAALWMLTGFATLAFRGGEAVPTGTLWFQGLLGLVTTAFFVGFWARGGRTLGMMAWRLRLMSASGGPVSAGVALKRFPAACVSFLCLGLGFLWALVDPERLTWHDRFAGTRVVLTPKRS